MVIKKNDSIVPFWGKGKDAKTGLNQLGMRTIVEALFASLLPGMNNVTDRIRYYSFYCWLLERYKEAGAGADGKYHREDFIKFLRTSEYLLAIINYYSGNTLGIPGITYVYNHIEDSPETINLADGIMTPTGTYGSYWANRWGVFGQYYVASILDMALIGHTEANPEFFSVSPITPDLVDGTTVAAAFQNSVGEYGELFFECVKKSSVTKTQAKELVTAFDMHSFGNVEERDLLIQALLQKDRPASENRNTWHRRDTIKYLLKYIQLNPGKEFKDQEFAKWMYDGFHQNPSSPTPTLIGWYAYYMEESWQYLSSIAFSRVLSEIDEQEWKPVRDVVNTITSEICIYITGTDNPSITLGQAIESLPESSGLKTVGQAYARILEMYKENREYVDVVPKSTSFSWLYADGLDEMFGHIRSIDDSLDSKFKEFVANYLVKDIIYRHYRVAFIKQRQTGIASQKFIIESGCIKRIMNYGATHTSPRLVTLYGFLRDLGAIKDNHLTGIGLDIIKRIDDEN